MSSDSLLPWKRERPKLTNFSWMERGEELAGRTKMRQWPARRSGVLLGKVSRAETRNGERARVRPFGTSRRWVTYHWVLLGLWKGS